MKKIQLALSALFCCLCILEINAQSTERSVFASAGKLQTGGGYTWNFTLGETLVQKFLAPNTILTQGFQQGSANIQGENLVIDPNSFAGATLQCQTEMTIVQPIILGSCGEYDMTYLDDDISGTSCDKSMIRTWNVWDACGNTATWVQTYIIQDNTPPALVTDVEEYYYLSCNDEELTFQLIFEDCGTPIILGYTPSIEYNDCGRIVTHHYTATDPCMNSTVVTIYEVHEDTDSPVVDPATPSVINISCGSPLPPAPLFSDLCDDELTISSFSTTDGAGTTYVTYTATDDCGHSTNFTQTVNAVCCDAPYVTSTPGLQTKECGAEFTVPEPTFEDSVYDVLDINFTSSIETTTCGFVETYTYTATNGCGLSVSALVYVVNTDSQPPMVDANVPSEITVNCNDPRPADPSFTDACDNSLIVELTSDETVDNVNTRIYIATDECGNSASFTQVITTTCCTPPVVTSVPETQFVECGTEFIVPEPTFQDPNGGALDITSSITTLPNSCGVIEVHSYTAINGCGMTATATVNVYITDTQDPFVNDSEQSNFIVECGESLPTAPGFVDACDTNLTIQLESETNENNTITRIWSAADDCGNNVSFTQTIEVSCCTPPVVAFLPESIHAECGDDVDIQEPTFTSSPEEVLNITYEVTTENNPCEAIEINTWTATNSCGLSVSATVNVFYTDTQEPFAIGGQDTEFIVECGGTMPDAPQFDDVCDYSLDIVIDSETNTNNTITRVWTATDDCGNTASFTQTIYVSCCNTPLVVEVADNMNVECGAAFVVQEPVFEDINGSQLEISFSLNTLNNECGVTEIHSWTATNECGLSVTASTSVNITDSYSPYVSDAEFGVFTIECGDAMPDAPQFFDFCDTDLTVEITGETNANNTITRVWTATDDCGNTASFTQTIYVSCCNTPLVVEVADNMNVECGAAFVVQEPVFEDINGSQLEISFSLNSLSNECGVIEVHSWTATNECGLSVTASTSVNITDSYSPYVSDAEFGVFTIECGDAMPDAPQFFDFCDTDLTVEMTGETNANNTITRVWTATDDCGNTASFTQTIYVSCCNTPLVVEVAANMNVECGAAFVVQEPVFEDINGSQLEISFSLNSLSNECGVIEVHSWTATNACGLSVTASTIVDITDSYSPYVSDAEFGVFTIECGDAMPDAPQFFDFCDTDLTVEMTGETNANNTITRVWTATDDCGNTASFTQTIYVSCCNTPLVVEVAANMNVECGAAFVVQEPVFEDINGSALEVSFSLSSLSNACGVVEVHSWTATNSCGLSVTASTIVDITDSYSPYVSDAEFGVFTIECGDAMPDAPQFFDFCDTDLTVEMASETNENNTITRVWTATDDCGNTANFIQTIYVSCCTAPEVVNIPATQFVECGEAFVLPEPTFLNTSDGELMLDHTSTITLQACGYIETHNWIATNACGLSATASFDVIVDDNTTPVFDQQLINIELSCGDVIPAPVVVTATDNCDTNVEVTTEMETIYEDECGNITWQVNYEATDDCGNSASTSYLIIMEDTEEPVLSACPDNLILDCGASLPAVPAITAMDACAGEIDVLFEEFELGTSLGENVESQCTLLTPVRPANNPCGYPVNWALALFGLPKSHRYYYLSEGTFTEMTDGSLLVEATIQNAYVPANGWQVSFRFDHGMNWEEWSTQQTPHSFKADCGSIAANHADWMYYLMMNMPGAEMIGTGAYAGSTLSTLHAPSNGYFGFQLGDGANNYNAVDNGFGGWFRYSGTFKINGVGYGTNNGNISGAGDLALELNCCEGSTIIRQWTASDCSGNTATCVQEITIGSNANGVYTQNMPDPNAVLETEMAVKVMKAEIDPNPASGVAILKFNTITNANTQVRIYSTTGELVATLMDSHSEEDIDFVIDFDTSVLPNGVYFCKITNGNETHTDRLIVTH